MGRTRRRFRCSFAIAGALLLAAGCRGEHVAGSASAAPTTVIRITGSDTMVNLIQAWAENYRKVRPDVSVQVAGGGSGVGIAGLINGILDIAASSRHMEEDETKGVIAAAGSPPDGFTVGLDALAVFVHKNNSLSTISIPELADVYGEGGTTERWSELGQSNPSCPSDKIIRVSRQNNSGTYVYFREALLGRTRELKLGSIDQSGSKDVVTLVSRTPCAIGYSGMAYATPGVRTLAIAKKKGDTPVLPTPTTALDGSYAIARPLFLYTRGTPAGPVKEFIDWTLAAEGQHVVEQVGFVKAPASGQPQH